MLLLFLVFGSHVVVPVDHFMKPIAIGGGSVEVAEAGAAIEVNDDDSRGRGCSVF